MKEMIKAGLMVAIVAAWGQAALPAVRVDVRDTAGYYIATGTEIVGTADGGEPVVWDTTQVDDGWWRVVTDGA